MKERVGKKIKNLRTQRGLSQEEVAEKLNISRSAYERMETGKSGSWASQLENLSHVFEVEPEHFVQEEKYIQNNDNQNGGMSIQKISHIKYLNYMSEELLEEFAMFLKERQKKQ